MANRRPTTITAPNVLAVEGEDDKSFFEALLRYIAVRQVQIVPVGGKDRFKERLPALLNTPGFYRPDGSSFVKRLAIVRDKDQDSVFQSMVNIVGRAGLTPPAREGAFSQGSPQVGILIMPGQGIEGTMLEDLCLETVKTCAAMDCVNKFAECATALPNGPKNASKAKCQAFLAAQPDIVNSVGLGAQKGYWDLDSPALGALKQFIHQLK